MATPVSRKIQRCRVYAESAFAADESANILSFEDVALKEGSSVTIRREALRVDRTLQSPYALPQRVLGARGAEASIRTFLAPTGTALDSTAATPTAPPGALGLLLQSALGGYYADGGSTETGSSTTTTVNVADGTKWSVGSLAAVKVNGRYEVRRVTSQTATSITFADALSGVPDAGSEVLNAHAFYMASDPSVTLQAVVEEEERDNLWWLRGGVPKLSFGFGLRELLELTFDLKAATYRHNDDVATPLGATLDYASVNDGDPLPAIDGEVLLFNVLGSGSSPVNPHPFEIGLELTYEFQPIHSPSGEETIRRWRMVPSDDFPVKLTLTVPSETDLLAAGEGAARTLDKMRDQRTALRGMIQFGSVGGKIAAVSLPNMQVVDVTPAESGGLHAVRATLGCYGAQSSSELAASPIVVGLL